jgi:very-short-patch-repair endonuclease
MATMSAPLSRTIAARHGIVSATELHVDGISRHAVRRSIDTGALVGIHKGVFRVATSPDTFESRCAAACVADPRALVTGVAAARLWGYRHVWRTEIPLVLVEHDRTPLTRGVILRRSNVIDAIDVVVRDDGIRVASPPRAWFDCARDVDDDRFERLTEWVLDHHASMSTLWRTFNRLQTKGRPGVARVRRVMSRRESEQPAAGSGLELRVLKALARRGIRLTRQHPIRLSDGRVVHPDGADPTIRWALEVDHVTWHGGRQEAQYDKSRDRELRLVGWQVERVTDQELREDFDRVIDQLVVLHRKRRSEVRAA